MSELRYTSDDLLRGCRNERERLTQQLAAWMTTNGFATGHGDTMEDLLRDLTWQTQELQARAAFQCSKTIDPLMTPSNDPDITKMINQTASVWER